MPSARRLTLSLFTSTAILAGSGCGLGRPVFGDDTPACIRCHTQPPATGAHAAHVSGGSIRSGLGCDACHPAAVPGAHPDGRVDFTWSSLAGAGTRFAAGRCTASYCHGATLEGGSNPAPSWAGGSGEAVCTSCHGLPPATHPVGAAGHCVACHSDTLLPDGSVDVTGGRHVNGSSYADAHPRCDGCHGAPPATGAHLRHAARAPDLAGYGDLTLLEDLDPCGLATDYSFGCGHCHPLDPARHLDGDVQVDLVSSSAAGIKGTNDPAARFDPATKRCSGVYCHSSGQPASVRGYAETPPWDADMAATTLGCAGCHGNPPKYANGGMGTDTANSHVPIGFDGHFGTVLPHGNHHGKALPPLGQNMAQGGAAFTCQVCHYQSVDPASTGPSGFYWLDVTADMAPWAPCTTCHTGAAGSPGFRTGRAWPLRHVNGRPDVVFDPRRTLPATAKAIYSGKPFQPSGPYWHYWEGTPVLSGADMAGDGQGTSWFHVANAAYDPATKACTSVACHFRQPTWHWGETVGDSKCGNGCHYQ